MTAAEEREAVVRWLRDHRNRRMKNATEYGDRDHVSGIALEWAADAIEAGTHIMEKSDGETANER